MIICCLHQCWREGNRRARRGRRRRRRSRRIGEGDECQPQHVLTQSCFQSPLMFARSFSMIIRRQSSSSCFLALSSSYEFSWNDLGIENRFRRIITSVGQRRSLTTNDTPPEGKTKTQQASNDTIKDEKKQEMDVNHSNLPTDTTATTQSSNNFPWKQRKSRQSVTRTLQDVCWKGQQSFIFKRDVYPSEIFPIPPPSNLKHSTTDNTNMTFLSRVPNEITTKSMPLSKLNSKLSENHTTSNLLSTTNTNNNTLQYEKINKISHHHHSPIVTWEKPSTIPILDATNLLSAPSSKRLSNWSLPNLRHQRQHCDYLRHDTISLLRKKEKIPRQSRTYLLQGHGIPYQLLNDHIQCAATLLRAHDDAANFTFCGNRNTSIGTLSVDGYVTVYTTLVGIHLVISNQYNLYFS
jgi:hypothetical protein